MTKEFYYIKIFIERKNGEKNLKKEIEEKDKNKALDQVIADIEKQFGKGAIMKLGDGQSMEIEVVSSGSLALDLALGVGGYPKGRIIEIFGPESSGKTTVALHAIAEAQKKGGRAAFIDAEHALDPVYAKKLGVDINELLLSQPDTGEQALEICEGTGAGISKESGINTFRDSGGLWENHRVEDVANFDSWLKEIGRAHV